MLVTPSPSPLALPSPAEIHSKVANITQACITIYRNSICSPTTTSLPLHRKYITLKDGTGRGQQTFGEGDVQGNVVGLCEDHDVFKLNNSHDILYV